MDEYLIETLLMYPSLLMMEIYMRCEKYPELMNRLVANMPPLTKLIQDNFDKPACRVLSFDDSQK